MPFDHFPSKRSTPDPHVELWWSKYRHTTGLVTECIAPNRQKIWKAMLGNPVPRLMKFTKYCLPFIVTVGAVRFTQVTLHNLYYEDQKHHWD